MTELIVVEKIAEWQRLKALVLDSVSSPITRRVYNMALEEFIAWFKLAPRPGFTKATVSAWRVSLEARGLLHGCKEQWRGSWKPWFLGSQTNSVRTSLSPG